MKISTFFKEGGKSPGVTAKPYPTFHTPTIPWLHFGYNLRMGLPVTPYSKVPKIDNNRRTTRRTVYNSTENSPYG